VLVLAPVYVMTHDMEFNASVVSKEEKSIKGQAQRRRKDGSIGKSTKGIDNAKEGSNVTIKNT
jgi:hypothetical protein